MIIASTRIRPRGSRSTLLVRSVASVLFGLGSSAHAAPTSAAATNTDASWIRFRTDPARRIFADLPSTRATADVSGPATAIRPVTTCADDGPGSLRAAIGGALDGDIIDLSELGCAKITLETGAIPVMVDSLTLYGRGRTQTTVDGNDEDRVFFHPYGGELTLHAMTIQRGRDRETGFDVAGGGCIASAGYLTLDDTTVRDCYAGGEGAYGGAIYAYSLTMSNSTLSGNVSLGVHEDNGTAGFGGAAFVYSFQLDDSTISGNRAEHKFNPGRSSYDIGGGIISVHGGTMLGSTIESNYTYGRGGGIATFGDITVSNSTLSGNVATTSVGGALFARRPSTLTISNSTLTANHATAGGGGIWFYTPNVQIDSSILFGNSAGSGHFADIEDAIAGVVDGGNNLVGDSGPRVQLPADTLATNPLLGPLDYNGGATRTHALYAGSPAIDTGTNAANLAFDQRGAPFSRVFGAAADIGAFERQPETPASVAAPVPTLSMRAVGLLAAVLAFAAGWSVARPRTRGRRRT